MKFQNITTNSTFKLTTNMSSRLETIKSVNQNWILPSKTSTTVLKTTRNNTDFGIGNKSFPEQINININLDQEVT